MLIVIHLGNLLCKMAPPEGQPVAAATLLQGDHCEVYCVTFQTLGDL